MRILYTLFLTTLFAITMERCRAEYLLVAVDDDDFRKPRNDDFRKTNDDDFRKTNDDDFRKTNDDDFRKDDDDFRKLKNDDFRGKLYLLYAL